MLEFSEQRCFAVFELSTIKKPHGIGFFCVTQCDSVVLSVKLVWLYHIIKMMSRGEGKYRTATAFTIEEKRKKDQKGYREKE